MSCGNIVYVERIVEYKFNYWHLNEKRRQYLKERIGIDLNRGENFSGRLVELKLGVGALVLREYWRIGGGGSAR